MKTYLVTGAAGFIGSRLASELIRAGHRVVTVDNLSTGHITNIPEGVQFIKGNCQDQRVVDQLFSYQFEAVYHIAGQSSGEISFDDPVYDLQTNTQSTLQLLKFCRQSGCRKFIYASSMSVYGDSEKLPVREDVDPQPKSFYAVGKLASEHYLRLYAGMGLATASLRLFNVYGPGQNLDNLRQGMVSIFLAQALRTGHIHVKGSADRFRDFVYIDEVVQAFLQTETHIREGQHLLFNVCSERKITVGEVVRQIVDRLGDSITTEFAGSTPGDQFGIYGSGEQAAKLIGWKPKTTFEQGMADMVRWAKSKTK